MLIAALVLPFVLKEDPIPQHTSVLTGSLYYSELMDTPSVNRFQQVARMDKETFLSLIAFLADFGRLQSSDMISVGEKVMIFIHVLLGFTNRQTAERWQHSGSTISIIIHEVSEAFRRCSNHILVRPKEGDPVSPKISSDPTFSPFFDDCIGAIDGVHINAFVGQDEHVLFRDRKKNLSQNVLAAVNFDMTFSYVLTGWEGSANDGRILGDARTKGFPDVPGKFFLGDGGFGLSETMLTPYRGVPYHIKEFREANDGGPRNAKELFNLKHSSLRMVVERCFGVLKKRFPILVTMPSFSFPYQCELVSCCVLIHNFIRRQLYPDDFDVEDDIVFDDAVHPAVDDEGPAHNAVRQWRDDISNRMWIAHQEYMAAN